MSILLLYLMQGSHYIMMMVCSNIYVLLSIHTTWSNNKKFSLSDGMHISLIKIGGYFSHRHKIVQFCPTVMFDNHLCANAIVLLLPFSRFLYECILALFVTLSFLGRTVDSRRSWAKLLYLVSCRLFVARLKALPIYPSHPLGFPFTVKVLTHPSSCLT